MLMNRMGKFLILTNLEAKNFRLMETPVSNTAVENWKEIIPHRSDVLLEGIHAFRDFYVLSERKDGLIKLKVHDNKSMRTIT
jgi:oligopeptidase B